jgi:hypothetical protein
MCRWTESISDKEHISKIFTTLANQGFNTGNYTVIKTYTGEIVEGFFNGLFSESNRFESYKIGSPEKFKFGLNIQNENGIEQIIDALDIYEIKFVEKENMDLIRNYEKNVLAI